MIQIGISPISRLNRILTAPDAAKCKALLLFTISQACVTSELNLTLLVRILERCAFVHAFHLAKMDYSDTFRRASSSRRYNDRAENSYGNVGSARLTSAVNHGPSNLPGPSTVPPRREDAENGNSNHRPSPGSARPRRDKPRPVIIEEYETEVFHHRPPDRRARVEDEAEPANPHTDPGPSSGPFVADRVSADRVSHSFLRPGGLPPPPPPPPPPYISHGISEERPSHRRHTGRVPLQPPPPYLVPQGFVTPSPYLVSSYQQPPDSGSGSGHGHGRTGDGSGGGGGRHDLATLAGQPDPKASEKVRSSIVICVYRRNRLKSFDYRMVQLRSSTARRPDRGGQGYSYTQDLLLFQQMRRTYENEMRGWVRRLLSFKALSTVRLLQVR